MNKTTQNNGEIDPDAPDVGTYAWQEKQQDWLAKDGRHGFVYFAVADAHLKIGKARDVGVRMRELQTGCPHKIELLGVIPSDRVGFLESFFHIHFRQHRVNGEWCLPLSREEIEDVADNIESFGRIMANNVRTLLIS